MLLENIAVGKTLEIYVDREGYRYRLVSTVEEAKKRRVCVTLIASGGRAFRFREQDDIRIVYRDEEQMWEWTQVKAGITKLDNEHVHMFEIVDKGRSFNRRNAYRVHIGEETLIGYYSLPYSRKKSADMPEPPEAEEGKEVLPDVEPELVRGLVKDVSETGVGIFSDFAFDTEDGVFFDIPSPYGLLSCKAQVVRKDELRATNHRYKYYYGCLLTRTDRKLIRYIYDVQREILKKRGWQQQLEKLEEKAKKKEGKKKSKKKREKK